MPDCLVDGDPVFRDPRGQAKLPSRSGL
jgi:hypothetical protein